MFSETQIESFRSALIQERDELLATDSVGTSSAEPVALDQTRVGRLSRMDALQVQAMAIETQRRRQLRLGAIEAALRRIDAGDFGLCLACEEPFDPRRLAADPTLALCIRCASRAEH